MDILQAEWGTLAVGRAADMAAVGSLVAGDNLVAEGNLVAGDTLVAGDNPGQDMELDIHLVLDLNCIKSIWLFSTALYVQSIFAFEENLLW